MALGLADSQTVTKLARLLYDFLPGSGNNTTAFPIAAERSGVGEFWTPGSKLPALSHLLAQTLELRRSRLCPLISEIVRQSMVYRGRKEPLCYEEVIELNSVLLELEFQIPELVDKRFLSGLPRRVSQETSPAIALDGVIPSASTVSALRGELMAMANVTPQRRGYDFEAFLNRLFVAYGLAPRESFRNRGEQIDGSFTHRNETFLLEAKWQAKEVAVQALWSFSQRVETKSTWARGLFISESGFTEDGLFAYRQGKPTSIVCMDGFDLFSMLDRGLPLQDVLDRKKRRAAETGAAFVMVRDLFP